MNKARSAHEIDGLKGRVLIDGFRFQSPTIQAYFLTHFHGDHYDGLTDQFSGPGLIHCTSVTARLLVHCLGVKRELIKSYEIGDTAEACGARVTFLSANHCPGSALLLFKLASGAIFLHTGDMRACKAMESYPELAAARGKIEKIYLDTTYSHPKHQFQTQEAAVSEIADESEKAIGGERGGDCLLLLSSYKIGKEKVMLEVARRTGKKIYVDEKKMGVIDCLGLCQEERRMFTTDMYETPIHVCRMGFAGDIWPYFQPKFEIVEKYIRDNKLPYTSSMSFIPTGWADGSKWNREHSLVSKGGHSVRIVAYSEHSNFQELQDFVRFLKPRQVVPTVFSDEKNCREIVGRFSRLVNSSAAMQAFVKGMSGGGEGKRGRKMECGEGGVEDGKRRKKVGGGEGGGTEGGNECVMVVVDDDDGGGDGGGDGQGRNGRDGNCVKKEEGSDALAHSRSKGAGLGMRMGKEGSTSAGFKGAGAHVANENKKGGKSRALPSTLGAEGVGVGPSDESVIDLRDDDDGDDVGGVSPAEKGAKQGKKSVSSKRGSTSSASSAGAGHVSGCVDTSPGGGVGDAKSKLASQAKISSFFTAPKK